MSELERARLVVLEQVRQGSLSLVEASGRLGLSYRQAKRVWRRYRACGAAGLVHGSRGRPSNRSLGAEFRSQCLAEYSARLEGFGPTLAAEKLTAWGYAVDHETLRRWLVSSGLWQPQRRRGPRHRRRERRERFGELVQLDGSFHDWFARGGEAHRDCLMTLIDDATGRRRSLLSAEETTADALTLLGRWIEQFGVPRALYTDRKSVYVTERPPTVDEQLAGVPALTAFGWACHRLGIDIIAARSPQAKGRVERSHAVYQDRLVKEIRLLGLTSLEAVNAALPDFDAGLDRRFAVPAKSAEDAHGPRPKPAALAAALSWESTRVLSRDGTLSFEGQIYQLLGTRLPQAKSRITVQRRLDGSLHLFHRETRLEWKTLEARPRPAPTPKSAKPPQARKPPAANHPWRAGYKPRTQAR